MALRILDCVILFIYFSNLASLLGEACHDGEYEKHVSDERSLHTLWGAHPRHVRQGADQLYKETEITQLNILSLEY